MLLWFWKITAAVVRKLSPSVIMESVILLTLLLGTTSFLDKGIFTWRRLPFLPDPANKRFRFYHLQVNDYEIFMVDSNS